MSFQDYIKQSFQNGTVLTRLIYINLGVFAVVVAWFILSRLGGFDTEALRDFLEFPASLERAILKPWTIVTYMFTQINFFHLLFNLVALSWFGKMFLQWLDENKLLAVYILGGLSGAGVYLLSYHIFPGLEIYNNTAGVVGASASIYAILMALVGIAPKHKIHIPLVASFDLRQLGLAVLAIDVFSIAFSHNIGGHLAHMGGALFGFTFGYLHKQGTDISWWLTQIIKAVGKLFKSKPKMKVNYKTENRTRYETDMEYNARKSAEQDEVNRILDKIGESGYESLTKHEKEILFKSSRK